VRVIRAASGSQGVYLKARHLNTDSAKRHAQKGLQALRCTGRAAHVCQLAE